MIDVCMVPCGVLILPFFRPLLGQRASSRLVANSGTQNFTCLTSRRMPSQIKGASSFVILLVVC